MKHGIERPAGCVARITEDPSDISHRAGPYARRVHEYEDKIRISCTKCPFLRMTFDGRGSDRSEVFESAEQTASKWLVKNCQNPQPKQ
jgi:hypothetical protein